LKNDDENFVYPSNKESKNSFHGSGKDHGMEEAEFGKVEGINI